MMGKRTSRRYTRAEYTSSTGSNKVPKQAESIVKANEKEASQLRIYFTCAAN